MHGLQLRLRGRLLFVRDITITSVLLHVRCNSQKYTYPRNYTPGIFSRTKISQKHTGGMFSHQAIRNG